MLNGYESISMPHDQHAISGGPVYGTKRMGRKKMAVAGALAFGGLCTMNILGAGSPALAPAASMAYSEPTKFQDSLNKAELHARNGWAKTEDHAREGWSNLSDDAFDTYGRLAADGEQSMKDLRHQIEAWLDDAKNGKDPNPEHFGAYMMAMAAANPEKSSEELGDMVRDWAKEKDDKADPQDQGAKLQKKFVNMGRDMAKKYSKEAKKYAEKYAKQGKATADKYMHYGDKYKAMGDKYKAMGGKYKAMGKQYKDARGQYKGADDAASAVAATVQNSARDFGPNGAKWKKYVPGGPVRWQEYPRDFDTGYYNTERRFPSDSKKLRRFARRFDGSARRGGNIFNDDGSGYDSASYYGGPNAEGIGFDDGEAYDEYDMAAMEPYLIPQAAFSQTQGMNAAAISSDWAAYASQGEGMAKEASNGAGNDWKKFTKKYGGDGAATDWQDMIPDWHSFVPDLKGFVPSNMGSGSVSDAAPVVDDAEYDEYADSDVYDKSLD